MKTQKRKMKITFLDEDNLECSIVQIMSKQSIGTWVWFFIDQNCKIVSISEIKD